MMIRLLGQLLVLHCCCITWTHGYYSNTTKQYLTPVGGPNVCRSRYRDYCCPGWTLKQATGLCIIPVCTRPCGLGRCIKPNICLCENGSLGSVCGSQSLTKATGPDEVKPPGQSSSAGHSGVPHSVPPPSNYSPPTHNLPSPSQNSPPNLHPPYNTPSASQNVPPTSHDFPSGSRNFPPSYNLPSASQNQPPPSHSSVSSSHNLPPPSHNLSPSHNVPPSRNSPALSQQGDYNETRSASRNTVTCVFLCGNGGSCLGGTRCVCRAGYKGDNCGEAECKEPCLNGGRCIGPDKCACLYGYAGRRCEADYRTGPCYTKVVNDMCQGQLEGVVCTKQLCCATVGRAWGHPCEHCPAQLDCDEGHLKNIHSGQCVDIDECEAVPGLCRGGRCINTPGSFTCECARGKSRNPDTNACEDRNECREEPNICANGKCVNTDGGFYCICNPGFIPTQDRMSCIDARQGSCYTSLTSDNQCKNKLPIRLSRKDCCCGKNMGKAWGDECLQCPMIGEEEFKNLCMGKIYIPPKPSASTATSSSSATGGSGVNGIPGSSSVAGQSILGGHYIESSVVQVDECMLRPGLCGGGACIDTPDGYECQCYPGYVRKKNYAPGGSSFQTCEDINECNQGFCQGGTCVNAPGSFTCTCPPGFDVSSDGKLCIDHDECSQNGMCANGMCINMDGSFKCQCKPGFVLSPTGHACIDVDECYENPLICLNGRCDNTLGSYRCACQPGYSPSPDGGFCVDRDECRTPGGDVRPCENGKCVNTDGSYKCVCDSGYRLAPDTKSCVDLDECISSPCQNGKCLNTLGSFRCQCLPGFNLAQDGRSCVDTRRDLCYSQYKEGQCSYPSTAPVTKSSCCCTGSGGTGGMAWGTPCLPCPPMGSAEFNTLCPHGAGMTYSGDDINECAQNPGICTNGACENLMGTYRCICNPGYEGDPTGKLCSDQNECLMDVMICSGGTCKNTPGSFQCICPTGTQVNVDSHTCEDIDECEELGDAACQNGNCVNTVGSYECECPPGFIVDNTGTVCIDNRKGSCWTRLIHGKCENNLPRLTLKTECCCSIGLAWGSPCETCHPSDCECQKGYAKVDGKICSDVNECQVNPGICKGGATCLNTEGSFTCICPPGLSLDTTGTQCIDLRLETCFTDYKHGTGLSPVRGVYPKTTCCCSLVGKAWGAEEDRCDACPKFGTTQFADLCPKGPGYVDKKDINECLEFPEICTNGRCRNGLGTFSCKCNQGYTLDELGLKCIDIDECSILHGVCGDGECQNIPGSFTCNCKEGYRSTAMMQICTDIDECAETPGLCRGGQCKNTPGSYHCVCPPGHELAPDKQSCKDIDECSRTSGICSNGICENMMGTYECVCSDGYTHTQHRTSCEDIDECEDSNGDCQHICVNVPGSYNCACTTGYSLAPDLHQCHDINECNLNKRICNGGQCNNTLGSYVCMCTEGLRNSLDLSTCLDINECEEMPEICGSGTCENNIGSFSCRCEDGYSVKPAEGPACTDENECTMRTHNCDDNADCINNPGSFTCRCKDGFVGNGLVCRDINECLTNNGGCNQNAQCINNDGSFKCVCDEGFRGDGYSCEDIDECTDNTNYCENGHCLNYPGSFRCECEMGFMNPDDKNEQACIDINECQMFNNLCVYGRCENTFGMFRCECNEGFQLDNSGGNCTDINECESPQACLYGNCTNTLGSFSCTCPPNYQLTPAGNACVDKRESRCYLDTEEEEEEEEEEEGGYGGGSRRVTCTKEIAGSTTRSTCCCSIGKAWGPQCEECPAVGSDEHKTLCPGGSGYRPNSATVVLEDINECEEHDNICENGHCTNTFGSFMCSCQDGFKLDKTGTRCVDIDECATSIQRCGEGFCVNDVGTYHCVCPDGYMLLPSGKECIDMRRELCYLNYTDGLCSLPMSNEQTRMVCCCSMGQSWGKPCQPCPPPGSRDYILLCGSKPGEFMNPMTNKTEEIDECNLMPNMCNHGTCMNTPGSFHCQCNRGFLYDSDTHQCIDDNECNRIPTPCRGNAQCVNSPGSYECQCPEGYKLGPTMRECIDIDECYERPGICANGDCANFQGSFQCTCANGYTLNTARDSCVDIDECARHPNICNNGTCVNAIGSFKCHCYAGFKLSHNNDCIDLDECRMMSYLCRNGRCRNNIGSFFCECLQGYTLASEGQYCRDVDECKEREGICPSPGKCQNVMGSFICTCPPGYRLSPDKNSCQDINECKENEGICEDGKCINIAGGVTCECPEGFMLSPNGMKCIDVRQDVCYDSYQEGTCTLLRKQPITVKECCCSMGQAWGRYCLPCPSPNSEDFAKLCPEGVGRGDKGEDLNECALMPSACQGGECINTDGSYRCECPAGYVKDETGKICIDDNECQSIPNICGNGTCTNLNGGFECTCSEGYAPGPLGTCEDINECLELSNQCAFRCHNVPGSFRCICPYGYALAPDGRHCIDVDECRTPANTCKFSCKNLIGSYMCTCPPGYQQVTHSTVAIATTDTRTAESGGKSHECVDVNECELNLDSCANGRCVNLEGSYRCECERGFKLSLDGKQCLDQRLGFCYRSLTNGRCVLPTGPALLMEVTRMDCCCTMGMAWGPQCQLCPTRGSQEYTDLCLESGLTVDGRDIDECVTIPDLCEHGKCINTQGSYRCLCNKGYKLYHGDTKCRDINECEQFPGLCAHTCTNTEGSYTCGCHPGFELSSDGSGTCLDSDECATGRHICQQICVNTVGSYSCACRPGFKQDGDHCRDIDECKEEINGVSVCPKPGTCINTMGSFRCLCPRGFKLDRTGSFCLDQDECTDDSKCREGCQNLLGGYKCGCPEGYVRHPFSNECIDDNECTRNPCEPSSNTTGLKPGGERGGKCFNTAGSYRCGCPDGFQFEAALQLCTQLSSSCLSSPCSFGCTPLGISGFSCECPSGYQRIGQGHCLATISSGLYPGFRSYERPNLGGIPTYPIVEGGGEYASQSLNSDKIISTEGCFSCKINGRHRRNLNHTDGHGKKKKGKKGDNRKRRHEHGFEPSTSITIHLDQTKHRSQIIKLQSAIKNDFEYYIEKGNEQGQFEMNKRHGVWRLHFRKRIKTPRVFNLIVNSRLIQNHSEDTKELNQHGKELNQHGKELNQHGKELNQRGKELSQDEKESNHHGKELSENEIERNGQGLSHPIETDSSGSQNRNETLPKSNNLIESNDPNLDPINYFDPNTHSERSDRHVPNNNDTISSYVPIRDTLEKPIRLHLKIKVVP